jgi:acetyl esterase/lipase
MSMPDVHEKWVTVQADVGDVAVRIVRPVGSAQSPPVILYAHGGAGFWATLALTTGSSGNSP